jgi:hypothetical protein
VVLGRARAIRRRPVDVDDELVAAQQPFAEAFPPGGHGDVVDRRHLPQVCRGELAHVVDAPTETLGERLQSAPEVGRLEDARD